MRHFLYLIAFALLASCVGTQQWAPDEETQRVRYRQPGPATVTLYTVITEGKESGAHTGLLINASQRVLWDPAGNFRHESIPERNDVVYGINPAVLDYYVGYHTIGDYYVKATTVEVTPEAAEGLMHRVMAYGAVGFAQCANTTSAMLSQTPGFESIDNTWFPMNIMRQFEELPNVTTKTYHNPTNKPAVLLRWQG